MGRFGTNQFGTTQFGAENGYTVSGNVTLSGSPVQGATIEVIDQTNGDLEATTTTDSNGDYSVTVETGITVHVCCRYEDGGTQYNSESKPFVTE